MKPVHAVIIAVTAVTLLPAAGAAQGLARKVTDAADGEVRMSFAARPDVCGDGVNTIRFGKRGRVGRSEDDDDVTYGDSDCPCNNGPVRVVFRVRDHQVTKVRTLVGGAWHSDSRAVDLGTVSAKDAVATLFAIANDRRNSGGDDAVFPTTLADSVTIWPELLRLARKDDAPHETRKQAVFWLSQVASDSATAGLADLAETEETEIRKQAVFGLSQRPRDEGVPALIKVARTNNSAEVRRSALFWLGQSEDPRALALFEEILTKR